MRLPALLLAGAAIALVALASNRPAGGDEASVLLSRSTGSIKLRNDRAGEAVVTARDMAPGRRARGRVLVGVNRKADMELAVDEVTHHAGPYGADLAQSVELKIRRIGRGPGGKHVYRGPVQPIEGLRLGTWRGGSGYRYRVRLRLPRGDASQNVLQGAGTQFTLRWLAHEKE
jgi:hypothetical protein